MRRTPEAIAISPTILKTPMSPVRLTCVPPAELDREGPVVVVVCFAHRDDPHIVAVLFAKERERALGDGAIGCQQAGAYCGVRADAPVDLRLDRPGYPRASPVADG